MIRCFGITLDISCSRIQIIHLSKDPSIGKWCLETTIWILGTFTANSLVIVSKLAQNWEICKYRLKEKTSSQYYKFKITMFILL